jgi:tetratricopeptide (TPR) repeat protein
MASSNHADHQHTISIDVPDQVLTLDDFTIQLTRSQTRLVAALLEKPYALRTYKDLVVAVHDNDYAGDQTTIQDRFRKLKERIATRIDALEREAEPLIFWQNVSGCGYRLANNWQLAQALTSDQQEVVKPMRDQLHVLLNQLQWQIRKDNQMQFYPVFRTLSEMCDSLRKAKGPDMEELSGFNLRVRVVKHLQENGQFVEQHEISDLVRQMEEAWRWLPDDLWRFEREALYLEQLGQFQKAGELSARAAERAEQLHKESFYCAALYARAAHCFDYAGRPQAAARFFVAAADLMAKNGQISGKALQYYRRALHLDPTMPAHVRIEREATRLQQALDTLSRTSNTTIAVVTNCYDEDLADALVHPFAQQRVRCCFKEAAQVGDLSELSAYDACIVVGGSKAYDTDLHVHQYFYHASSCRKEVTFETLDMLGQHYSDWWHRTLAGRSVYVLAGLTREETCRAIMDFSSSTEVAALAGVAWKQPKRSVGGGEGFALPCASLYQ